MTTEETSDGQSVKMLILTREQLASAFAANQAGTVISIDGLGSALKVHMPIAPLLGLRNGQPDAFVQVIVDGNGLQLPIRAIEDIPGEGNLTVTVAPASGAARTALQQALERQGAASLLGNPVVFTLDVDGKALHDYSGFNARLTLMLPEGTAPDKATAVWMDADNKLHFAPSLFASNGIVTIHSFHDGMYAIVRSDRTFADLQGHWAQKDVEMLANKLIVDGQPDGRFAPNDTITRAEFAALLVRVLGLSEASASDPFSDVDAASWYAGAVGAARQAGLIGGFGDCSFRPDAGITREQLAVMIARALAFAGKSDQVESTLAPQPFAGKSDQAGSALAPQPFADSADISDWAFDATKQLAGLEIVKGMTETTFVPAANATRAQSAVILVRMLQYMKYID